MNRERLQRIRNFQSEDWYPALVIRPLTIGIMLIVADWRFLTPNRVTTLANLSKLAGAWLVLDPSRWVLAVVLLQLGLLLDHLDGTIARYRCTFTKLGSYYDKVSDMITWAVIVMVVGWQAYRTSGDATFIVLAAASVIALNLRGYMKWLTQAETERIRWLGLALLIDRLDLLLWLMMISQCAGAAAMVVVRAIWLARADRRIRELEGTGGG